MTQRKHSWAETIYGCALGAAIIALLALMAVPAHAASKPKPTNGDVGICAVYLGAGDVSKEVTDEVWRQARARCAEEFA